MFIFLLLSIFLLYLRLIQTPKSTTTTARSSLPEEEHKRILRERLTFITQNTILRSTGLLDLLLQNKIILLSEQEEIHCQLDRHGNTVAVSALIRDVCIYWFQYKTLKQIEYSRKDQ